MFELKISLIREKTPMFHLPVGVLRLPSLKQVSCQFCDLPYLIVLKQ